MYKNSNLNQKCCSIYYQLCKNHVILDFTWKWKIIIFYLLCSYGFLPEFFISSFINDLLFGIFLSVEFSFFSPTMQIFLFIYFLLAVLFIISAPWIKYKLHTPRLSKALVSQQYFCGFSLLDFMCLNVLTLLFQTNAPFIHIWLGGSYSQAVPKFVWVHCVKGWAGTEVLLVLLVFKAKLHFPFFQL